MAIPAPEAHVGDMPQLIRQITNGSVIVDVSVGQVDLVEMRFNGPGGAASTIAAGYVTDGTDGLVTFDLLAGTWSASGQWLSQVHFTLTSGTKDHGCTIEHRTVHDRIF